jgi:spore coat-associated protein N
MSRFKILAANPRRSLAALATVLIAVGVTGASGASFNATTANPSNTFTAGTLTMTNSKAAAAILTASNMKPGDPATKGTVDIKNTGSLAGAFTLGKGAIVDSDGSNPMSAKLNVVVTDCGTDVDCALGTSSVTYTGTLAAMPATIALGSFAGGIEHRYEFAVAFDSSATNAYQGDNSVVPFTWDAS